MDEQIRKVSDRHSRAGTVQYHPRDVGINKKLETPSEPSEEKVGIETIITGAVQRGLSFEGIKEMTIGQIVDFCIEYNEINEPDDKKKKRRRNVRKATQADWDAFLG